MNLEDHKKALNGVGWFIPPYLQLGFLTTIKTEIDVGKITDPHQLESFLAQAYSAPHLAAMVQERYATTPTINEYYGIIAEAVEAHFSGLGHVAVSGLLPVIEGTARKLAKSRDLPSGDKVGVKTVFAALAKDCKKEAAQRQIGDVGEILTMMDAFVEFTHAYLYEASSNYPLADKMNRHGMLHGAFSDGDYGRPVNFYKAVGALDVLCMISAFRVNISWLAPDPTPASNKLCAYYVVCAALRTLRPG
ncbi:MAG TPA: hypothetical protein VMT95_01155 [Candidatus Binatia bacterium]|nr:hypothetical protein [Candidatus Binatia bacterium]